MYIVARFDNSVGEEAREAILESEFVSTILQDLYYTSPDDTVNNEAFMADVADGNLMMAHDQRGSVTHATIANTKLPKDVLYIFLDERAAAFTTEATVTAAVQPNDFVWENDAQRDAAEIIRTDVAELAVNIDYPNRATVFQIGQLTILCAIWSGHGELYMKSMQDSYDEINQLIGEGNDEGDSRAAE